MAPHAHSARDRARSFDPPGKFANEQITQPLRLRLRGTVAIGQLGGDALDEIEILAVEQMPVRRAMLGDLLPAVAIDPALDAGRERANRWRGNHRSAAAMLSAFGEALLITLIVNLLHLGGAEPLIAAVLDAFDQRINVEAGTGQ